MPELSQAERLQLAAYHGAAIFRAKQAEERATQVFRQMEAFGPARRRFVATHRREPEWTDAVEIVQLAIAAGGITTEDLMAASDATSAVRVTSSAAVVAQDAMYAVLSAGTDQDRSGSLLDWAGVDAEAFW